MSTAEVVAITIAAVTTLTPIIGAILQAYTDRQKMVAEQTSTLYARVLEDNARLREERNEYRTQRDEAEKALDAAQAAHAQERQRLEKEIGQLKLTLWSMTDKKLNLPDESQQS